MSMWRCPHCATPQPETARCWVCHRSSTTCSTCRNFRRSVAAQIGFCGLDRRHLPLAGTEHRGCWEGGVQRSAADGETPLRPNRRDTNVTRQFVPVELASDRIGAGSASGSAGNVIATAQGPSADVLGVNQAQTDRGVADRWAGRATLFGDPDR